MDEESLIILGVVSIVSAFIAMAIFDHKGRSASNGFALGFFLGWIGVIIAAVSYTHLDVYKRQEYSGAYWWTPEPEAETAA